MNLRKLAALGPRGFTHIVAPLVIVVLVSLAGTYMLVASHADSIKKARHPVSGPVSGPTKHIKKTVYIHVVNFTLTSSYESLQSQLLSRTSPVTASDCNGSGSLSVKGKNGFIFSGELTPTWNANTNVCEMNARVGNSFAPARYSVYISFRGNSTLKAYKHVTFYRDLTGKKVPQRSGTDANGETIVVSAPK